MVISFSDSMQLTFAARDRLIAGEDKVTAFSNAIRVVGPACVLTHATAGISFLALQFSNSDLIRAFGEAGLARDDHRAAGGAVVRAGVRHSAGARRAEVRGQVRGADAGVTALRNFCAWIAVRMVGRPALFSLIAFLVVAGLAFRLLPSRAALSSGRSGAGQAAGG